MEQIDIMILLFFSVLIIFNVKEIGSLIIPTKKRKIEIVSVIAVALIILIITFWYGKIWSHYLVGILLIVEIISVWIKRGITKKGFNSTLGLSRFHNWNKINYVEVYPSNNDNVRVSFINTYSKKDSYYFKKEDCDKIINVLSENLPKEKVRVKQA
jgi:c-di-AMP phosphodiesterase-like protein